MSAKKTPKNIVACIDAPDPDNLVMLVALFKLFKGSRIHILLTGRPVKMKATKKHQTWEWEREGSIRAQEVSAQRVKNFLKHFGINHVRIFNGGIAPRTSVPHHVHFKEYYKFNDVDPLEAVVHSELEPQERLIHLMLKGMWSVVIGAPMTGLYEILQRNPEVADHIEEIHAMYGTWGKTKLLQFEENKPRKKQFNLANDPNAGHAVLMGLDCPIYLLPTEVTRVPEIGFKTAQELWDHLPSNDRSRAIYQLYLYWFDAALYPSKELNPGEKVYIHDLCCALSLDEKLRNEIYEFAPIDIESIPHLINDRFSWGEINMKQSSKPSNPERYAGLEVTEKGKKKYLEVLYSIFE